jgi:hypothetical protein
MENKKISKEQSGYEKVIEFFDNMEHNHPVSIKEIEKSTGLSWTYIKKLLFEIKEEYHLNLEKSGGIWIVWKKEGHLKRKLKDTCSQYLK